MSTLPASTTPWFGRAWTLTVTTQQGQQLVISSNTFEPESLRITFEVSQVALQTFWFADISIYNLDTWTEQFLLGVNQTTSSSGTNTVISQGDLVELVAGYQVDFGVSGPIWLGKVLQPMWERQDGTDFKLTLHCIIGLFEDSMNVLALPIGPLATQAQIVQQMAQQAHLDIESLDTQTLGQRRLPRSRAIFGTPGDYFQQIALGNKLHYWIGLHGINLVGANAPTTPSLIYGPLIPPGAPVSSTLPTNYTPTLVGVPQQTQEGLAFRVLLDSRLTVGQLVGLNQSAIRQIAQYPLGPGPTMLSQDGTYYVGGVRHVGDSRGTPWFSEVTGITPLAWQTLLNRQASPSS